MIIRDLDNKQQTDNWLRTEFGPVTIHTPPDHTHTYEITELNARTGHACIIATVLDQDGNPMPDIPTVWSWPDAPPLAGAGWTGKGVVGTTNDQGIIGHAMGNGADYTPPTKGPHSLWIQGTARSQMIEGLGMITLLGRYHLDVTFQIRTDTPGEPDPPPPPIDIAELETIRDDVSRTHRNLLRAIDHATHALRLIDKLLLWYTEQ